MFSIPDHQQQSDFAALVEELQKKAAADTECARVLGEAAVMLAQGGEAPAKAGSAAVLQRLAATYHGAPSSKNGRALKLADARRERFPARSLEQFLENRRFAGHTADADAHSTHAQHADEGEGCSTEHAGECTHACANAQLV